MYIKTIFSACLLLALSIASAQESNGGKRLYAKSIINQKAPELIVQEWLTQVPETRGKFVLIDFSATWCHACRKAMPELNEYQKKYADKLVVIFITKESREKILAAKNFLCELAIASDTLNTSANALAVKGIPHNLLIDPKGYVRWEGFPATRDYELTEDVLISLFEKYAPGPGDALAMHDVDKVIPEPSTAGKVKALTEVDFTPSGKPESVEKRTVLGKRVWQFNEQGKLTEEKYFKAGDTLVSHSLTKYDHASRPVERICFNADGSIYTRTILLYNEKGNLIGEEVYDASGKVDCKSGFAYNKKGNLVEESLSGSDGGLRYRTIYKYKSGRLVEKIIYDDKGKVSSKFIARYNNLKRPVETAWYGPKSLINKYTYAYDAAGNRVEDKVYRADGSLSSVYKYVFDNYNNKVEELAVYPDGRKIIQYNYRYDAQNRQIETRRSDYGVFYLQSNSSALANGDQIIWDYWNQGKPSTKYISRFENKDRMGNWLKRVKTANNRLVGYTERQVEYHDGLAYDQPKGESITKNQ